MLIDLIVPKLGNVIKAHPRKSLHMMEIMHWYRIIVLTQYSRDYLAGPREYNNSACASSWRVSQIWISLSVSFPLLLLNSSWSVYKKIKMRRKMKKKREKEEMEKEPRACTHTCSFVDDVEVVKNYNDSDTRHTRVYGERCCIILTFVNISSKWLTDAMVEKLRVIKVEHSLRLAEHDHDRELFCGGESVE